LASVPLAVEAVFAAGLVAGADVLLAGVGVLIDVLVANATLSLELPPHPPSTVATITTTPMDL
jgi:hypothetical protein